VTIVVGVATPDGIVLAADSRTIEVIDGEYRIASDTAIKLFELDKRVGVVTYGLAFIGPRTIASLVEEFAEVQPSEDRQTLNSFARKLGEFFDERLRQTYPDLGHKRGHALGFLVAGYEEDGVGYVYEVNLPGGEVTPRVSTTEIGFVYHGEVVPMERLLKGVDWERLNGRSPQLPEKVRGALEQLAYEPHPPVSMQDAVDLCEFIIGTTINVRRFTNEPGAIVWVGGPVRILTVERTRLRWLTGRPDPQSRGDQRGTQSALRRS
jgi:hypothetical protein